jgi:hypothetical protein
MIWPMSRRAPTLLRLAAVLAGAGSLLGCGLVDPLDGRLKTCRDAQVDLVNSPQTLGPVHLAAEGEAFTDATWLPSGASRRITLCLERGDRKSFRAGTREGAVLATATCVAEKTSSAYESGVVRVVWTPAGLLCEAW